MIAIIDYKAGNLTSVNLAFQTLSIDAQITSDPDVIRSAERVVFPGVGAAGTAMKSLTDLNMIQAIQDVVSKGTPFLGICLGTQIILDSSEEDGGTKCIGLIQGQAKRFKPVSKYDKIPQMGWNSVNLSRKHPVFEEIPDNSEFYFVHSYYPLPSDIADRLGETSYADISFASVMAKNNIVATQFHPEKSGRIGLRILENFARWNGKA